MFHRRQLDATKASVEKFLNPQNGLQKRLKHLALAIRAYLEKQNEAQTKEFFSQYYYVIYQVFHDAFTSETTGKVGKGGHLAKGAKDELFDLVLPVFETILVYTPELLYQKWQCNSIGVILKKLLHPQNQLRVRKLGLQYLLLWLQSLRDNIVPIAEELLVTAVPEFPPKPLKVDKHPHNDKDWFAGPDYHCPVLPVSTDGPRPADDPTMEMIECLLDGLVSQSRRLAWEGNSKHCGFDVLFHLFKKHFLYVLFPQALKHRGPYTEKLAFEDESSSLNFEVDTSAPVYDRVRERIVNWLVQWITPNRGNLSIGLPASQSATSLASSSATSLSEVARGEQPTWWVSRKEQDEQTREDLAMLMSTLYSSQENVILLHEMMRRTFHLSFAYLPTMETVLVLMQDWLAQEVENRPEFMQERSRFPGLVKRHSEPRLNLGLVDESTSPGISPTSEGRGLNRRRYMTYGARASDPNSPTSPPAQGSSTEVRIGLQPNLRLFISEAAQVFVAAPNHQTLHEQVEACMHVIKVYQTVAMKSLMDRETWAHLLSTLLQITRHVLGKTSPPTGESSVSQQLAGRIGSDLVKTVFVLWMNASLSVSVSTSLWDDVLHLLGSLTHWPAVIDQWKHIMKMMTRLLGQYVYGIHLSQHSSKHPATRRGRLSSKQRAASTNTPLDNAGSSLATTPSQPPQQRQIRHKRDHSISTNLEQFSGDPIAPKPMPVVEEACENKEEAQARSVATPTSTTANLKAARDNAKRRRSELMESGSKPERPKFIEGPMPSVDLTSPLRDVDSTFEPDTLDEEDEDLESIESSTSIQGYSVQAGRNRGEVESSDSNAGSDMEENGRDRLAKDQSGSQTDISATDMHDSLLPDNDGKSVSSGPTDTLMSGEGTLKSGSTTPMKADSDRDDDLPPVRRGRASTLNSLEAKQLFNSSGPGGVDTVDEDEETHHLEVLAGGARRGWTPASAAVLWRRTLGILGDPNKIPDPMLHAKAIGSLAEFWEDLLRIRNRDGEPVESEALRTETAQYEPPMLFFAPWVLEACTLGVKYKEGQLRAYQLLCRMLLERYDRPLPADFLTHSYRLLHIALTSQDRDLMDCVVWHSSTIFSTNLPGATILIGDYLNAAEKVLTSSDSASARVSAVLKKLKSRPRREALVVLGSLLHYAYAFPQMALQGVKYSEDETTLESVKDKLIQLLLHTTKKEPFRQSRCLALSMLGLFVYSEYLHASRYRMLIIECINVLLLSIRFPDHSISTTALDTILLLTNVRQFMPEQLPLKIVEILITTIPVIINEKSMNESDTQKIAIRILFCLLDWLMTLSAEKLSTYKFENLADVTLMQSVFQVLTNLTCQPAPGRSNSSDSQTKLPSGPDQSSSSSLRDAADGKISAFTGTIDVPKLAIVEPVSAGVQLAAKTVMSHLVNMLGHFPSGGGAANFSSSVLESHDITESADLNKDLFNLPCVQFFMFNKTSLLSLIELPAESEHAGKLVQGASVARIVIRDLAGKWCWDSAYLHGPKLDGDGHYPGISREGLIDARADASSSARQLQHQQALSGRESVSPSQQLMQATATAAVASHSPSGDLNACQLPSFGSFLSQDGDIMQELLHYVTVSSPEALPLDSRPLDTPVSANCLFSDETETALVDTVHVQHTSEQTQISTTANGMASSPAQPCDHPTPLPFQNCRCLLTQLGFLNLDTERRRQFNLLQKSDQLLRELRNIDSRPCRETHKIGVVYVRHGQHDKESVLSNTTGSQAFEEFMAAMTWEVDLNNHPGFKGGLKPSGDSDRNTAPYFASSTAEMLFHVATRMANSDHPGQITKLRHIGNDEIIIVWSEHSRDWRRDIIKTEFGDVMIVIYPMANGLYRVQILKKESNREGKSVPFFGPLFDGAVVDKYTLPGLVRATAINASRARRSQLAYFEAYYVERNKYIQSAIKNCELNATLEQFTSLVIRPGSPSSGPDSTPMVSLKVPGLGREHSRGSNAGTPVRQELSITVDEPLSPNNPRSAGLTSVPSEEVDGGLPYNKFTFSDASGLSGGSLVARGSLGDDVLTPRGWEKTGDSF